MSTTNHATDTDVYNLNTRASVLEVRLDNIQSDVQKISNNVDKYSAILNDIQVSLEVLKSKQSVSEWAKANWVIILAAVIGAGIPELLHHILK